METATVPAGMLCGSCGSRKPFGQPCEACIKDVDKTGEEMAERWAKWWQRRGRKVVSHAKR